jgi:hypothetical protein
MPRRPTGFPPVAPRSRSLSLTLVVLQERIVLEGVVARGDLNWSGRALAKGVLHTAGHEVTGAVALETRKPGIAAGPVLSLVNRFGRFHGAKLLAFFCFFARVKLNNAKQSLWSPQTTRNKYKSLLEWQNPIRTQKERRCRSRSDLRHVDNCLLGPS